MAFKITWTDATGEVHSEHLPNANAAMMRHAALQGQGAAGIKIKDAGGRQISYDDLVRLGVARSPPI